jgi:Peptidase propeptide and YPEB domain
MHTRTLIPAIILACLAVTPAAAQTVGVYVPPLSAAQAQDVAVMNGVIAIRKIEFDDGAWKVEGRARDGGRIEMKIHPQTGEILKLERYY